VLSFSSALRVFVYGEPCDMRCSFERLSALTKNCIGEEPYSGHLFLFLNRTKTSVKILYFDRTGYCIWYKRLESGTFSRPTKAEIDYRALSCILEGIEEKEIRTKKRFLLRKTKEIVV
jgi:transposase